MTDIWASLDAEFALWRDADLRLPFWWRDDDAFNVTPELDQLLALANQVGVDVFLAVIPSKLQPDLPPFVAQNPRLIPVTHGYAHQDHTPAGVKKCEYASDRDAEAVSAELVEGYETLKTAFADRFVPMFVPPWNRFGNTHKFKLQKIGYKGFSTYGPRSSKWSRRRMEQINTHVDPINWRGGRALGDRGAIIQRMVGQLADRRLGKADNTEPYGYLTHHKAHDADIWAFSEELLTRFAAGPVDLWAADAMGKRK